MVRASLSRVGIVVSSPFALVFSLFRHVLAILAVHIPCVGNGNSVPEYQAAGILSGKDWKVPVNNRYYLEARNPGAVGPKNVE